MKNILIISIIFILAFNSKGQVSDLKKKNLNGKVCTVKEVFYECVDISGNSKKCNKAGDIPTSDFFRFDTNGSTIEEICHLQDGQFYYSESIRYDERGRKTETIKYGPDSSIQSRKEFLYDDQGNNSEINEYISGELSYNTKKIYDSKRNVVETQYKELNGVADIKITYKYDNNGNNIEESWLVSYLGMTSVSTTKRKYDSKGNIIEVILYQSDNSIVRKDVFKYDQNNNIIENTCTDPGGITTMFAYKYTYDSNNNWTKQIKIMEDKSKYIITREITYY